MPLVEMKSNLSQINTNFGSDTTTAGKTNSFAFDSLNTATLPRTLYLDIKGDFPSLFSPTNKAYPNQRTFSIDTTNYTDIKGDTTSFFSPTNKAAPNFYNTGNQPTPIQQISTTGINGFINHAATANQYGFTFTPLNNSDNKFPTIRPVASLSSRIYFKHQQNREINAGFTRPALSLSNYYDQANDNTGQFGIRNNGLKDGDQPYITREIGQRWGINNIPTAPGFLSKYNKFAIDAVKTLSADVFGRDITVFGDRYLNDVIRLGRFANPFSTYAIKQTILQRRNKYNRTASILYGPIKLAKVDPFNVPTSVGDFTKFSAFNPQVYNIGSIFSTPGVSGLMFHRMGTDLAVNFQASAIAANAAANLAYVGAQIAGITAQYSARAISIAAPVAANVTSKSIGGIGNILMDYAKGASNPLAGLSNPLAGLSNPLAGLTNPLAGISNPLSGLSNPLAGVSNPLAGVGNPFANASIKALAAKLPSIDLDAAKRALSNVGGAIGDAAIKARDVAKDVLDGIGPLDKIKLMQIDASAFADIGIDKINLIPYAKEAFEDVSYDRLDWIPFKFQDLKLNAPIVFRATLSGITDTFSPEYSAERYIGRPDNVYVYQGTNREISFTFDVHPSSAEELLVIWEKLNYLAGQTYPHWTEPSPGGGRGMESPATGLTIGDMYKNVPGFISSLTYTIQDQGNWEVEIGKLPKYIQVACSFTHIGNRLPSAIQKHFDLPRIPEEVIMDKRLGSALTSFMKDSLGGAAGATATAAIGGLGKKTKKDIMKRVGL